MSGGEAALAERAASEAALAALAEQVVYEAERAGTGARLSARLRASLERLPPAERARAVSGCDGIGPLHAAARRGNLELAEYLVHVCGAPLEQRAAWRRPPEVRGQVHYRLATPLWVAAAHAHLAVACALADAGAALDARCDAGCTPLHVAAAAGHESMARALCARGAALHAADREGATCLMRAVRSPALVRLLLERGAPVQARDSLGLTALHHAAHRASAEAAGALLAAGAEPRARCAAGDTALRVAATHAATPVVEVLLASGAYTLAESADAYELLGAAHLHKWNDTAAALEWWRRGTEVRAHAGVHKAAREPCAALGGAVEWRSARELDEAAARGALHAQALLVVERVLGAQHSVTLARLDALAAREADARRNARAAELYVWLLRLLAERHTLLCLETGLAICALLRLALVPALVPPDPAPDVALRTLELIAAHAPEAQRLASARPHCPRQGRAWELALQCGVRLAALAGEGARAPLVALAALRPRTHTRRTLLHLAAAMGGARVVRLLLRAGADVRTRDEAGRTALHEARGSSAHEEAAHELLAGGAHVCTPDARGHAARDVRPGALACLAACALLHAGAPPPLPRALRAFLDLHRFVPDDEEE